MSESRNISKLPKGIVSEEQIERSEEINRKFMELSGMQETAQMLESTFLREDEFRYASKIEEIKNSLQQAFGEEDYKLIIITNRFLHRIEEFMDAYKALEEGSSDPEEQNDLERSYISSRLAIRSYLLDYGKKYRDKFKEDNPNLSRKEVIEKISNKFDEFIDLLIQNLEYVPPKEGK